MDHLSLSPYNAFDNNPVFWADPSGGDSEYGPRAFSYDFTGRRRYDENGFFIPAFQRGKEDIGLANFLNDIQRGRIDLAPLDGFSNYFFQFLNKPPIDTGELIKSLFTRILQYPYEYGCSWACKKSTDLFFGINNNGIENDEWLNFVKDHGASIDQIIELYKKYNYNVNEYGFADIHKKEFFDEKSIEWMANEIGNGRVVQIGWEPGLNANGRPIQHNSIITRVEYNYETKKLNLSIMNPAKYESKDIKNLYNLYKIFRIYSVCPN